MYDIRYGGIGELEADGSAAGDEVSRDSDSERLIVDTDVDTEMGDESS